MLIHAAQGTFFHPFVSKPSVFLSYHSQGLDHVSRQKHAYILSIEMVMGATNDDNAVSVNYSKQWL